MYDRIAADWKVDSAGLAWSPQKGLAIPVPKGLKEISWEMFLQQLSVRLDAVREHEDYAETQYRDQWMAMTGSVPSLDRDQPMNEHPMTDQFQDYLTELRGISEDQFPQKVVPSQDAKDEMQRSTSVAQFLGMTLGQVE